MKHESFDRLWNELSRDAHDETFAEKTESDQLETLFEALRREKSRRQRIHRRIRSTVAMSLLLACSLAITIVWRTSNPSLKTDVAIQPKAPTQSVIASTNEKTWMKRPRGRLIITEEQAPTVPEWQINPISDEELLAVLPPRAKLVSTPTGKKLVLE